jgi:hypothetical protein
MLHLAVVARDDTPTIDLALMLLDEERPPDMGPNEFRARLEKLIMDLPTRDQAHAQLKKKVAALRAELTERLELIALKEERDLDRAIENAKFDAGPQGDKRRTAENSLDRLRRASLKELRAQQKARSDEEPEPATDPTAEPEEPDVTTEETGSTVTNGTADEAPDAPAPVTVGATPTTPEADTPQELRNEPTCHSGSQGNGVPADATPEPPLLGAGLPTPPIGRPKVFWPPGGETFGPEDGGVGRPAPSDREDAGVVRPAPSGVSPEEAAATIRAHPNDRDPERRIRLGYVLPPFRAHPMGQWLRTLFDHHDRGPFEVIGYGDARGRDAVTDALRAQADGWCDIAGQSHDRVADQIRADRIDILIDLTGHAVCSRLSVLARKPAPLQVTVLGRPATMGLDTIDYRLTDGYLNPPGQTDNDGIERLIRLPHSLWVFQPAYSAGAFPITPLPALARGFITFGSLNPLDQVTPALEYWRKILHAVPASRLLLLAPPGSDCDAVSTFFAEGGIGDGRLAFVAHAGRVECLRSYDGIDIALDPFPCSAYASILDALWMGVPVVTLAGRTAMGRAGVSILSNLGLSTPIGRTPGGYVEIAVGLAGNLELLENMRPGLRDRLLASPLADGKGYTAGVEAVLRKIWQTWCGKPG